MEPTQKNKEWEVSAIYPTMWQPTYAFGLPLEYTVIAIVVGSLVGTFSGHLPLMFPVVGVFWFVGRQLGKKDPEFSTVYLAKLQLMVKCKRHRELPEKRPLWKAYLLSACLLSVLLAFALNNFVWFPFAFCILWFAGLKLGKHPVSGTEYHP